MKFNEKIRAIALLAGKTISTPSALFLILKDETTYRKNLQKRYGYTCFRSIDFNYFLKDKEAKVDNYAFLEGGSLVTDLALLRLIAQSFEQCEYLEIGTWRGESIVNVADVANTRCTSVNLSPEEIIARGFPDKYANEHGCLIKGRNNITQIHADSQKFNFNSLGKKFDLIFIDGDHKYEAVKTDTENTFPLLRDKNSVIVWHDYSYDPVTPRHSVIQAILDGLPKEAHQYLYHVSNTMCAIYTQSDSVKAFLVESDSNLDKVFSIKIESKAVKS